MDEPLVELHWGFLSKFVDWMRRQRGRQYFIATHSAQLMDACSHDCIHLFPTGQRLPHLNLAPHELVRVLPAQYVLCVEGNDEPYLRAWKSIRDALPRNLVVLCDNYWHKHSDRLCGALQAMKDRVVMRKMFVLHDLDYYRPHNHHKVKRPRVVAPCVAGETCGMSVHGFGRRSPDSGGSRSQF